MEPTQCTAFIFSARLYYTFLYIFMFCCRCCSLTFPVHTVLIVRIVLTIIGSFTHQYWWVAKIAASPRGFSNWKIVENCLSEYGMWRCNLQVYTNLCLEGHSRGRLKIWRYFNLLKSFELASVFILISWNVIILLMSTSPFNLHIYLPVVLSLKKTGLSVKPEPPFSIPETVILVSQMLVTSHHDQLYAYVCSLYSEFQFRLFKIICY